MLFLNSPAFFLKAIPAISLAHAYSSIDTPERDMSDREEERTETASRAFSGTVPKETVNFSSPPCLELPRNPLLTSENGIAAP